jgi:hypothetical protein
MDKQSQANRILNLLKRNSPRWVSLPRILNLRIARYGARIWEMRRSGVRIEAKDEYVNGQRHTAYRYVAS